MPSTGDVPTALLLVDLINDLEFDGGDALLAQALPAARRIAALKAACAARGIPAIYVNDNFGRWRSDFRAQVRHCLDERVRGRPLAVLLRPADDDYFVLKAMHSGFYCTPLELLLRHLGTRTVIVTGIAGDLCILFTAHDAHMRGFRLVVPADCTASEAPELNARAVDQLARLGADVRASTALDLDALAAPAPAAEASRRAALL